jgi:hypothetical protein
MAAFVSELMALQEAVSVTASERVEVGRCVGYVDQRPAGLPGLC